MSGHCVPNRQPLDMLTSSGHLSLVFPSVPDGRAEPVDCSGASTLCPHHSALPNTAEDGMASVADGRTGSPRTKG